MAKIRTSRVREGLVTKKAELEARLERINANLRRPLDPDSAERAMQMEDQEVVDSLGNEAREELSKINGALDRLASGDYGVCDSCGDDIDERRLMAHPYAAQCISCATEASP